MASRTRNMVFPRTPRQREILIYIRDYSAGDGFAPTYEEIAAKFGISKVTVFEHIHNMAGDGLVTVDRHKSRSVRLSNGLVLGELDGVHRCQHCGQQVRRNGLSRKESSNGNAGVEQAAG